MRMRDLEKASGVGRETIRYYIREGLLPDKPLTDSTVRTLLRRLEDVDEVVLGARRPREVLLQALLVVAAAGDLLEVAIKAAQKIASFPLPAVMMAKETVDRAFESTLGEGLRFERRVFHSLFATEDQKEGMAAFSEKRKPVFKNR